MFGEIDMKDRIKELVKLGKQANVSPDFYEHLEELRNEIEELNKLKQQKKENKHV
jgi:hypothetical protein